MLSASRSGTCWITCIGRAKSVSGSLRTALSMNACLILRLMLITLCGCWCFLRVLQSQLKMCSCLLHPSASLLYNFLFQKRQWCGQMACRAHSQLPQSQLPSPLVSAQNSEDASAHLPHFDELMPAQELHSPSGSATNGCRMDDPAGSAHFSGFVHHLRGYSLQ
jgi:hypothetical protein